MILRSETYRRYRHDQEEHTNQGDVGTFGYSASPSLPVESPAVEGQCQTHHTGEVLGQVLDKIGRIAHRGIVQEQCIKATISYKDFHTVQEV